VFDDGRLTDGKGRVVDFSNTIIIATSNIGSDVIQRSLAGTGAEQKDYEEVRGQLMDLLKHHFRPEFLNRVDEVVVFRALGREQIGQIVELQLRRVAKTAERQHQIKLEFDKGLVEHLADVGYDAEYGARMLKRKIRSEVETRLADAILGGEVRQGERVIVSYDPKERAVRLEKKRAAEAVPA
jgi:ATP-dependent Clp protease ATP-binding subunit ClpC